MNVGQSDGFVSVSKDFRIATSKFSPVLYSIVWGAGAVRRGASVDTLFFSKFLLITIEVTQCVTESL